MGSPNKGRYGANDFVPYREVVPIAKVMLDYLDKCPLWRGHGYLGGYIPYPSFHCNEYNVHSLFHVSEKWCILIENTYQQH